MILFAENFVCGANTNYFNQLNPVQSDFLDSVYG